MGIKKKWEVPLEKQHLSSADYYKIVTYVGCSNETFVPEDPLDNIKPSEPNPLLCPHCQKAVALGEFIKTLTLLE